MPPKSSYLDATMYATTKLGPSTAVRTTSASGLSKPIFCLLEPIVYEHSVGDADGASEDEGAWLIVGAGVDTVACDIV